MAISATTIIEIQQLLEESAVNRINNSLRIILMDYLRLSSDYPVELKNILTDLNIIFDLLKLLEDDK